MLTRCIGLIKFVIIISYLPTLKLRLLFLTLLLILESNSGRVPESRIPTLIPLCGVNREAVLDDEREGLHPAGNIFNGKKKEIVLVL